MNTTDSSNDKGSTIIYKYECLDCENYKRKVIETEQTVSGRDVLIEMLQQEIKKMEERYKTSIDDYEKLRFKYCTVVQDLGCLKEIHKKLEKSNTRLIKDRDIARNHLEILQKEIENCQKQSKFPMVQSIPSEGDGQIKRNMKDSESLNQNILKEVMNMEVIMQNQNETVKEVLLKVLDEMKTVKGSSKQIEEEFQKASTFNTYTENTKDQSKEELLNVIKESNKKIDELNVVVENLKQENEAIVKELTEKKTSLAQCLEVLEDNHSNLNHLSGNIEMIINEKQNYLNETLQLKKTLEENEKVLQLKNEEISELKSKCDKGDSKASFLELDSMKKRNEDLQKALNESERDLEKLQDEYLEKEKQCTIDKCKQLAKALIEAKMNEDKLNINETKSNMNQTDNVQVSSIKDTESKGTDAVDKHEHVMEINSLKEKINFLENELRQIKLENTEYEEENKSYSQKLEALALQLQELEKEKLVLENTPSKGIPEEKYEVLAFQKDSEIAQLKNEIEEFKKKGDEHLRTQLADLQNKMQAIQEKDEELILQLQEKINRLENTQIQKQMEIDQCCCVVQNIKETLADKSLLDENHLCQLTRLEDRNIELENEKQQLQKCIVDLRNEIANYEYKFKDCDCKFGKQELEKGNLESYNTKLQDNVKELEIELCRRECLNEKLHKDMKEMEIEICRKQCTINHLEQCLDKSNKILGECEKEMKEMHSENENARGENKALKKDLQNYAMNVQRSSTEKKDLQEKVTRLNRQSLDLEMEKDKLSITLQEKSTVEDELNQLKKMYNNLIKTSKEKDEELNKLQNALDCSKKEYDKIVKAYKEIKETLAEEIKKYKQEVEKIIKEKESFHIDLNPSTMELKKLHTLIEEKEQIIKELERQKRELSVEITQLKSYANKIITDNKNLRTAIDNLLTNLVEKVKTFTDNAEDISLKSNEILVKDILNSLLDLERSVMTVDTATTSSEKCNCMSVIMSTYKIDANDIKAQNLYMPPCKHKCGKKVKDLAKYVNSKLSSSEGIVNTCQACCADRQKEFDQKPSDGFRRVTPTRSVSESFAAKPNYSW